MVCDEAIGSRSHFSDNMNNRKNPVTGSILDEFTKPKSPQRTYIRLILRWGFAVIQNIPKLARVNAVIKNTTLRYEKE